MPIETIDPRLRELGRIRAGEKRQKPGGKPYPARLNTFRLTSPQRELVEEAAGLWGGDLSEWTDPAFEGTQWQVTVASPSLPIVVVGPESFDQHFELWKGGVCSRRCTGITETLGDTPCLCDPDPERRECEAITRMNVLLPDISDLGQWRLEAGSYYAAVEIKAFWSLLSDTGARMVPAWLALQPRSRKVIKKGGGVETRKFNVPIIQARGFNMRRYLEETDAALAPIGQGQSDPEPARRALAPTPDPEPAVEAEPDTEEAWAELVDLLAEDPDGTIPELDADLRRMFRLGEVLGLWPGPEHPSGHDSLHRALEKLASADHVGDLTPKARLVEFCEMTWATARDAVRNAAPFDGDDAA